MVTSLGITYKHANIVHDIEDHKRSQKKKIFCVQIIQWFQTHDQRRKLKKKKFPAATNLY